LLKKLFSFPPTIAFLLAFIVPKIIDYKSIEPFIDPILESLGATMVPMALFSVGLQLQFKEWKADKTLLINALNYKLILAPLLILGVSISSLKDNSNTSISSCSSSKPPPSVTF